MYVDGVWETVATVSSSTLTYRLDGLDANTEYLFKVKAYIRDANGTAQFGVVSSEFVTTTKSTQVEITSYSNTTYQFKICAFSKDVSPVVWGTTSSIYSVTTSK